MRGDARAHASGSGAAARLALVVLLAQGPAAVSVGRVTAVAWPPQQGLAVALAEAADRSPPFPGVGPLADRPIRLILAPTRARFDSLTRGRLPSWSEGAAFPDAGTVVLLSAGPPDRLPAALRHELAHLALRWRVRRLLPLWFEEGYAAVASGEWDRLDVLRLNWQVARGVEMDLDSLDRVLRADRTDAETAYGLATTAVLLLERWGGGGGGGGSRGLMPAHRLARSRRHFGPRSWVFLAADVVSLAAGYCLLARGSTKAGPVLLVFGYCVFLSLGLGL